MKHYAVYIHVAVTTVAIVASVQPVMRHSLRRRLNLINAPVIMNVTAKAYGSRQTPVYPYAAMAGSTDLLAAG